MWRRAVHLGMVKTANLSLLARFYRKHAEGGSQMESDKGHSRRTLRVGVFNGQTRGKLKIG